MRREIMKKVLMLLTVVLNVCAIDLQEKIKLYAMYTSSHEHMMNEFFLPSIQDDYDIIIEKHEQQCASGEYMANGWLETMIHKVDIVIRGIKENWNKVFIHSDVDIQFFRPTKDIILSCMEGNDIAIQAMNPIRYGVCAGFFACRGNEKTLNLWLKIRALLVKAMNGFIPFTEEDREEDRKDKSLLGSLVEVHDQSILNSLINTSNPYNIKWCYLPEEFYGSYPIEGGRWVFGKKLNIPKNIIMHHATWTVGLENKQAMLAYVRDFVKNS